MNVAQLSKAQHFDCDGNPLRFGAICFLDKNRRQLPTAEIMLDVDGKADGYNVPEDAEFVRAKTSKGWCVYEIPIYKEFL